MRHETRRHQALINMQDLHKSHITYRCSLDLRECMRSALLQVMTMLIRVKSCFTSYCRGEWRLTGYVESITGLGLL